MERRKLTKEDIDSVRGIAGFPIASDEDIIALSDAPYYTACPNPFLDDFIKENGTPYNEDADDYHREPFSTDVSEGKMGDPIYNAHSYHTKVPHKAIMRYILNYTDPDDIVFDGFCGSGMTGVAAQMCGSPDSSFKYSVESSMKGIKWGARKAILSDLSPMATFLSAAYTTPCDQALFQRYANEAIEELEKECGWMEETNHADTPSLFGPVKGKINYTIWSDVFICPHCGKEIINWQIALNKRNSKGTEKCYYCGADLGNHVERAMTSYYDHKLNEVVSIAKEVPVQICYSYGKKKYTKDLDEADLAVIKRIEEMDIPYWYPIDALPDGFNTEQPMKSHNLRHVHQFYTKRNLYILSKWMDICNRCPDRIVAEKLKMVFTGVAMGESKLNRYLFKDTSFPFYLLSGTLYVGGLRQENNPIKDLSNKALLRIKKIQYSDWGNNICINTGSSETINIPDNSVDYVFVDPPFGGNLNYSELSFIWEAWLKIKTDCTEEAIMNPVQKKALPEYQELMLKCFMEFYRILKPGRWMTVEFHNSKNAVWNAIQEALQRTGFVIADVRTLDKQQQSFKQVNFSNAVQQDLIITAYKPKETLIRSLQANAGSEETAWDFVQEHLTKLPVVVNNTGKIEIVAERQPILLWDRMVAYHIMRGISVPIDATDFYKGLESRYLQRDGMYFLPNQVNEYDTARIVSDIEPIQFSLMVTNEKTAIAWLYQQLDTPQKYSEIQPKFMQEVRSIDKYEDMPELSVLLEENFLQDDKERWYVPDVTKEADVAKLREKNLLKEFESYLATKGRLKLFRAEAIRVGFAKLWKDKNYKLIVETAERLPEQIIQEDDKLLMYYDISLGRV